MNHPKPEEWVPYLYGETKSETRRSLRAHLKACPECRDRLRNWKHSLGRLDAWKLGRGRTPAKFFAPALKWAPAAALVLAVGFLLGHFSTAHADAGKLRTTLEPELRQQLRQEMAQMVRDEISQAAAATLIAANERSEKLLTDYATASEANRSEEMQRLYVALKREVDTVAVNTDAGLQLTEQQLVRLASYKAQPNSPETRN